MSKFIKYALSAIFAIAILFSGSNVKSVSAATCVDILVNISVGDKGQNVIGLQTFLAEQGFLKGKVDGAYGPVTRDAVVAFQTSKGLVSNPVGYVGPSTRQQIKSVSCGTAVVTPPAVSNPTVNPPVTPVVTTQPPVYQQNPATYLQPNASVCQPGMLFNTATGFPCVSSAAVTQHTGIPGCTATTLFSTITGQRCVDTGPNNSNGQYQNPVTLPIGCAVGASYSIVTGLPCNANVNAHTNHLKPDLLISNMICSTQTPKANDMVSCIVTINNDSSVAVNNSFMITTQGSSQVVASSLGAWQSTTVTVQNAFSSPSTGSVSRTFIVDPLNTVEESDEDNNRHTKVFSVQTGTAPVTVDLTQNFSSPSCPYTLGTNLDTSSTGSAVIALQNFLKRFGYYSGNSHGSYTASTEVAVIAYQNAKGISPADGLVGPTTRAAINTDCNANSTTISGNLKLELGASTVYMKTPVSVAWYSSPALPAATVMTVELIRASDRGLYAKKTAKFSDVTTSIMLPTTVTAGQYKVVVSAVVAGVTHKAETVPFTVPEPTVVFAPTSNPTITVTGTTATTKALNAEFKVKMSPRGEDVALLAANDISVVFVNPNGNTIPADTVTVATAPRTTIKSGEEGQLTITAKIAGSKLLINGLYKAELKSIRWGTTQTANFSGTYLSTGVQFTK